MNIIPIRGPMPALLVQPPAGQHRVYHRWWHRGRARGAVQTTFADAEEVIGNCSSDRLNADIGLRIRLAPLESP